MILRKLPDLVLTIPIANGSTRMAGVNFGTTQGFRFERSADNSVWITPVCDLGIAHEMAHCISVEDLPDFIENLQVMLHNITEYPEKED
jgi:hypothetical protein